MKKFVEDWLAYADEDLIAADVLNDNSLTNAVAFHCQQAIEKYFKAFLIENDILFPRIHNLIRLYGMIQEVKDLEIDDEKLDVINGVYTNTRYPGEFGLMPDALPSHEQAKDFIEFAQKVKTIIRAALGVSG